MKRWDDGRSPRLREHRKAAREPSGAAQYQAFGMTTSVRRWALLLNLPHSTLAMKWKQGWRPELLEVKSLEMTPECFHKHPKIRFPSKHRYCQHCKLAYLPGDRGRRKSWPKRTEWPWRSK